MPVGMLLDRLPGVLNRFHRVAAFPWPAHKCYESGPKILMAAHLKQWGKILQDIERFFVDPKDRETLAVLEDLEHYGFELVGMLETEWKAGIRIDPPSATIMAKRAQIQEALALLQSRVHPPPANPSEQAEADPVCTVSDIMTQGSINHHPLQPSSTRAQMQPTPAHGDSGPGVTCSNTMSQDIVDCPRPSTPTSMPLEATHAVNPTPLQDLSQSHHLADPELAAIIPNSPHHVAHPKLATINLNSTRHLADPERDTIPPNATHHLAYPKLAAINLIKPHHLAHPKLATINSIISHHLAPPKLATINSINPHPHQQAHHKLATITLNLYPHLADPELATGYLLYPSIGVPHSVLIVQQYSNLWTTLESKRSSPPTTTTTVIWDSKTLMVHLMVRLLPSHSTSPSGNNESPDRMPTLPTPQGTSNDTRNKEHVRRRPGKAPPWSSSNTRPEHAPEHDRPPTREFPLLNPSSPPAPSTRPVNQESSFGNLSSGNERLFLSPTDADCNARSKSTLPNSNPRSQLPRGSDPPSQVPSSTWSLLAPIKGCSRPSSFPGSPVHYPEHHFQPAQDV